MQTRLPALLLLPLVMLLGGCPVWGNDGGGGGNGTCRTNGDCAVGSYCLEATDMCTVSTTCTSDAQCSPSQNCDYRDTCVPDVPDACRGDGDCTGGTVCVEGFCRATGIEVCQFDLECASGLCVDSACTFSCTSATQCGSGQVCTGGRCVTDATQCTTTSDCSGSKHCVDGRCLADCTSASCSDAQDTCGDDHFCRPHWQQSGFCTNSSQCAAGSVCDIAAGICRIACTAASPLVTGYSGGACGGSFANADCACQSADAQFPTCGFTSSAGDDDYCRTTAETVSDCEVKAECGASQHCIDGSCN